LAGTLLLGDSPDDQSAAVVCGFDFAAAKWGYGSAYARDTAYRLANFPDILNLNPSSIA
jgi:phosphoglycolate phosphatase-like HAD superfamily hydrolase